MSNFVPVSPVVGSRRWRLGSSTAPYSIVTVLHRAGTARGTVERASVPSRHRCMERRAPKVVAQIAPARIAWPPSIRTRDIRATRGHAEAAARPAGAALEQQHIAGACQPQICTDQQGCPRSHGRQGRPDEDAAQPRRRLAPGRLRPPRATPPRPRRRRAPGDAPRGRAGLGLLRIERSGDPGRPRRGSA